MTKTTITTLPDPHGFSLDPLTDILCVGARDLTQQAVEAALSVLLKARTGDRTEDGRARLVRHGHLQERDVMTGSASCLSKFRVSATEAIPLKRFVLRQQS